MMIQDSRYKSQETPQSQNPIHPYDCLRGGSLPKVALAVCLAFFFCSFIGCDRSSSQQKPDAALKAETAQMPVASVPKGATQEANKIVQSTGSASEDKAFQPFYIFSSKGSRENHYIPSGFMPNGNCITFSDVWQKDCQEGSTCIKIIYDVECSRKDQKWAGVYWLNPANNWGRRKGGFDLTGAKKLTFWAKGEKGGEQIQEFTVGGINGDYPDSDTAVMGPVILGTQWRQYTIDLRGKDLSYISGGFAWTTSEDVNPEGCTFYLDSIRFE